MEKKEFLREIHKCRRRLNLATVLRILVFALCVGAGVGILFQLIALLTPFYYVNHYSVAAVLLAALVALVASYIKRSSMKQAALTMDSFGFQERIVTAYEHLEEKGRLLELQREDAMRQLQAHKERIKLPVLPSGKKLIGTVALYAVMIGLAFVPAATKEQAKELHQVKEEAKEKEKEIEEVVENLEELKQEALTPEQLTALQEMMESLQSSMTEYNQAVSAEMLATANEKLDYKYGDMSSQLADLAASLQNGATPQIATSQAMQSLANQLQQMSGNQSLASNQNGNNGQSSQSGNSQNSGQNGQSGNGQNGQSGQNGSQSGQSGTGQNSGQNGQSGTGQNGQGSGQGNSPGSGQGNGNGSGNGSGNGQGTGGGRGEGSSDTMHDYVSIPNAIIDSGNLTGTAQNHDNSEFFRTQNGLAWEGTPVSYDAVIGQYEQNAYEGISAGQYPSGMEEVIKDYFASFN